LPRARLYFDPGATWHAFEPIPDNNGNPLASTYYRPRGLKAGLSVSGNYYYVTYDGGLTFKFDSSQSYRLQTATDRNNNSISFQYTSGKITSVTDTVGRILTFGRASGDIDNIGDWTQPVPRTTSYTYNPSVNFFTNQNNGRTEYRDLPNYSGVAIVDPKKQNDDPNFGRLDTPTSEWTWTNPYGWWSRVGAFSYIGYNGAQQFKETYTFSYPGPNTTVVTDPRGNQITYTWDPRTGAVTQVQDAMNKSELREYNYNLDLVKTSDRQGNEWRRDYEVYGQNLDATRLTAVKDPLFTDPTYPSRATIYGYTDASNPFFPTSVTDQQANQTTYQYSASGNLNQVQFKLSGIWRTASYVYDPSIGRGLLTSMTDPEGKITTYGYVDPGTGSTDSYFRLRKIRNPLAQEITMDYDAFSRMTQKTDAEGQATKYDYDKLDNTERITYRFNQPGSASVAFDYDANGNLIRTTETTDQGTVVEELVYNHRNQLVQKLVNSSVISEYAYDAAGNMLRKYEGSQDWTQYEYDSRSLLWKVYGPGGALAATLSYFDDYTLQGVAYNTAPAVAIDYQYNTANRLTSVVNRRGSTTLRSFSYSYVNAGKNTALRYSMTDGGVTTTYGYNEMNHLTRADGGGMLRSWTYNANGNRMTQEINGVITNYQYDNAGRLTQAGSTVYAWYNNGNLKQRGADPLVSYDGADRATRINDIAMTYLGPDQTQRLSKGSVNYEYDGTSSGPTVESPGQPTEKHFITSPSGRLIGLYFDNYMYYYLFDGSDSVVGLVDNTGLVWNSYTYEPFGELLLAQEWLSQPYKFHGGYYDSDTGFYKMGARYYEPGTGRFTQPEPAWANPMFNTMGGRSLLVGRSFGTGAGVGQGTTPMPGGYYRPGSDYNWYSYAGSEPVNGSDANGYQFWKRAYGIGLMVGGAALMVLGALSIKAALATGPFAPFAAMPGLLAMYGGAGIFIVGIEKTFDVDLPNLPRIRG
ncbi:MAG: RHS repeat-associated core domain-containing protein, partial [Chloroflexi bacterium]|nr:RHS repeat-associated core domain-containing protein [Chloroflexota bacterium]